MNLLPLNKPMPEMYSTIKKSFERVLETLPEHAPSEDIVIAGKCLVDSYLDKPAETISVYIQDRVYDRDDYKKAINKEFPKLIKAPSAIDEHMNFTMLDPSSSLVIDVHFVDTLEAVYDIGIRLLQFYMINDEFFASEDALEDLQKKQLVLSTPYNSFENFSLLFELKQTYGFSIEKDTLKWMEWYVSLASNIYDDLNDKDFSEEVETNIDNFIEKVKGNIGQKEYEFPFSPRIQKIFTIFKHYPHSLPNSQQGVFGKNRDKLLYAQEFEHEMSRIDLKIDWKENLAALECVLQLIKPFMTKHRVSLMFEPQEVSYTELDSDEKIQEVMNEIMQIAQDNIQVLEESIGVLRDDTTAIEEKEKWFSKSESVCSQDFEKIIKYSPLLKKMVTFEEYVELFKEFYKLAYKEKDVLAVHNQFINGPSKNLFFFKSLVNFCDQNGDDPFRIFSSRSENLYAMIDEYFPAPQGFNDSRLSASQLMLEKANDFNFDSLQEQVEQGYETLRVITRFKDCQFLMKRQGETLTFKGVGDTPIEENAFLTFFTTLLKENPSLLASLETATGSISNENGLGFELNFELPF